MSTLSRCAQVALLSLVASGCTQPHCANGYRSRGGVCIEKAIEHSGTDAGQPDDDMGPVDDDGDGAVMHDDAGTDAGDGGHVEGACDSCPEHAECKDAICTCLAGFVRQAGACIDVNECGEGASNPCGPSGSCDNTTGSYSCACGEGSQLIEGAAPTCMDENECEHDPPPCGAGTCFNTDPSYYCECPAGYEGTNTLGCSDIDECETNHGGCGVAPCANSEGTFSCGDCPAGFVGSDADCQWNDARLADLVLSDASLSPAFDTGTTAYFAQTASTSVTFQPSLPAVGLGHALIAVGAEEVASGATSSARPLALGDNNFEVKVSAESGATRSYAALVRRGWNHDAYIKAPNAGHTDAFGHSIALSADGLTLAVGAWDEDSAGRGIGGHPSDDSAHSSGAVYLFRREAGVWMLDAYLKASNADPYDHFGASVALSADGKTLVAAATDEDGKGTNVDPPLEDDNSVNGAGAAYVFERSEAGWAQTAYLKASNPSAEIFGSWVWTNSFGSALSISGDGSTIAVAARGESSPGVGVNANQTQNFFSYGSSGAVYVFRKAGAAWLPEAYIKSMATRVSARFGEAVALSHDGSLLAVGEPNSASTGAAYTYTRDDTTWTFEAKVVASNAGEGDLFGHALALSSDGSKLLVGAPAEDSRGRGLGADMEQTDNSSSSAGAAYLFRHVDSGWEQQLYIKASNATTIFGNSVALAADGQTFVVGSPAERGRAAFGGDQNAVLGGSTGAAYLFRKQAGAFRQVAYVKSPRPRAGEAFGEPLVLDSDGATLAVGVEKEAGGARGVNGDTSATGVVGSGAVFLYE